MKYIDLNSDVGEGFGSYKSFEDERLYEIITSANIACGYHAGDPMIMEDTINLCSKNKVELGAHPGFPDLLGFGRRKMEVTKEEAAIYSLYQLGALHGIAKAMGKELQHFKLHGAFYNMVMSDYEISKHIIQKVKTFQSDLVFLGLANSAFIEACKSEGVKYASEVFADRAYDKNGQLVSRKLQGAVIKDKNKAIEQVKRIVLYGEVKTIDETFIKLDADSICIHGDNEEALCFADNIRSSLEKEGVKFQPLKSFK